MPVFKMFKTVDIGILPLKCTATSLLFTTFTFWTSNRKVASSNPRADKVQICRSAPEQAVNPLFLDQLTHCS